ncbi:MAG: class I SAM-dependent methyltransferase [Candidatus Diapherotrites archaeon]
MSFTERQRFKSNIGEVEYIFPYHYGDLGLEKDGRNIKFIEYLARIEFVKKIVEKTGAKKVLDAGCGDGRFIYEMKNKGIELVGVDFSEKAIGFAKAFNPEAKFIACDLKNLQFKREFDCAVCIETFEHIGSADLQTVLKKLNKSLKDNGVLVLTVPTLSQELPNGHYQHFSEESLIKTFGGEFEVAAIYGLGKSGLLFWVFTKLRYAGNVFCSFGRIAIGCRHYFRFLGWFYKKFLLESPLHKAKKLVAVCRKKGSNRAAE